MSNIRPFDGIGNTLLQWRSFLTYLLHILRLKRGRLRNVTLVT